MFYMAKIYFKSNTTFQKFIYFMLMDTVSCKPDSKCFGRHREYFCSIYSKRNQYFSINFTTMWNFLNTVLFCEGLEFGESVHVCFP